MGFCSLCRGKDGNLESDVCLKVLELYSGIGGIHFSLGVGCIPHVIAEACDINTVANEVYKHNFGTSCHSQRNILSLSASEIDEMKPNLLTMSPPCQPFTRVGRKNDCEDSRTSSFLHVLNVLNFVRNKPRYIFIENVKGFESSEARILLLNMLTKCDYAFQEFLLSPVQFGIPNSRLRYYLLAKRQPAKFCFQIADGILNDIPSDVVKTINGYGCEPEQLFHYLQDECSLLDSYLVPDKILMKYVMVMDIVDQYSRRSCCFTKAYSHYAQGTGSVLVNSGENMSSTFEKLSTQKFDDAKKLQLLKSLRLRYFTPREVANLMCFPPAFQFPPSISKRQQYQVLGNSVNIRVVSELLKILICDH